MLYESFEDYLHDKNRPRVASIVRTDKQKRESTIKKAWGRIIKYIRPINDDDVWRLFSGRKEN